MAIPSAPKDTHLAGDPAHLYPEEQSELETHGFAGATVVFANGIHSYFIVGDVETNRHDSSDLHVVISFEPEHDAYDTVETGTGVGADPIHFRKITRYGTDMPLVHNVLHLVSSPHMAPEVNLFSHEYLPAEYE